MSIKIHSFQVSLSKLHSLGNDVIACESHSNGTESKYHNSCKTECQRIGLPIDH